jgi:hypothetical protein
MKKLFSVLILSSIVSVSAFADNVNCAEAKNGNIMVIIKNQARGELADIVRQVYPCFSGYNSAVQQKEAALVQQGNIGDATLVRTLTPARVVPLETWIQPTNSGSASGEGSFLVLRDLSTISNRTGQTGISLNTLFLFTAAESYSINATTGISTQQVYIRMSSSVGLKFE